MVSGLDAVATSPVRKDAGTPATSTRRLRRRAGCATRPAGSGRPSRPARPYRATPRARRDGVRPAPGRRHRAPRAPRRRRRPSRHLHRWRQAGRKPLRVAVRMHSSETGPTCAATNAPSSRPARNACVIWRSWQPARSTVAHGYRVRGRGRCCSRRGPRPPRGCRARAAARSVSPCSSTSPRSSGSNSTRSPDCDGADVRPDARRPRPRPAACRPARSRGSRCRRWSGARRWVRPRAPGRGRAAAGSGARRASAISRGGRSCAARAARSRCRRRSRSACTFGDPSSSTKTFLTPSRASSARAWGCSRSESSSTWSASRFWAASMSDWISLGAARPRRAGRPQTGVESLTGTPSSRLGSASTVAGPCAGTDRTSRASPGRLLQPVCRSKSPALASQACVSPAPLALTDRRSPRPCCSAACGSDPRGVGDGALDVATTVAPITSIAANIGGDRVDVDRASSPRAPTATPSSRRRRSPSCSARPTSCSSTGCSSRSRPRTSPSRT